MANGAAYHGRQQEKRERASIAEDAWPWFLSHGLVHVHALPRSDEARHAGPDRWRKQGCRSRRNLYRRKKEESRLRQERAEETYRAGIGRARRREPFVSRCRC